MPTTAFSTVPAPSIQASVRSPSAPLSSFGSSACPASAAESLSNAAGSVTATYFGWNSAICASSLSTLELADRPNTS